MKDSNNINDVLKSFTIINVNKYLDIINKIIVSVEHKKEENKSETETKDE